MQLKRFVMILLVVILTVSAATIAVSADTGATFEMAVEVTSSTAISVDPLVINTGDTVTVKITIEQNPGITLLMTKLRFDDDAFTPVPKVDDDGYIKDYTNGTIFEGGTEICYLQNGNEIVLLSNTKSSIETDEVGLVLEMDFVANKDFDGKAEFYLNMSVTEIGWADLNKDNFDTFYDTASFISNDVTANVHTFEKGEAVAPTCTEVGYVPYTCTECGKMYKGDVVDALGHTEVIDEAIPSTCTTPGKTQGSHCSVCNEVIIPQQETAVGGHQWGEWETVKAPTEKEKGTKKRTCDLCGATEEGTIPELDHVHKYIGAVTAPTCTEKGYTLYECECGDIYKDDYVDATGHDHSGAAATCVAAKTCVHCGEILEAKLEHNDQWEIHDKQDAGCVTDGWESYIYCPVCKIYPKEKVTIPANGTHTPGAEASCTAPQICTTCNEELAPAKGHTEAVDAAVAPTCTETGLTEGKHCSVCNEVLKAQESVPAVGHVPVTDPAVEPTYSETGLTEGSHCSVCDEILEAQEILDKKSTAPIWIACIAAVLVLAGAGVGIFFIVKKKGKK